MTSLEGRWFWPLKDKKFILSHEFAGAQPEIRTDYYFPTMVDDVGLKWREDNIEIKTRINIKKKYKVSRVFSHVSQWDKHIVLKNIDPSTLDEIWIPVKKTRWTKAVNNYIDLEVALVVVGKGEFLSLCIESKRADQKTAQLMEKKLIGFVKSHWDSKDFPLRAKHALDYPGFVVGLEG